jgi:hypothetical protein
VDLDEVAGTLAVVTEDRTGTVISPAEVSARDASAIAARIVGAGVPQLGRESAFTQALRVSAERRGERITPVRVEDVRLSPPQSGGHEALRSGTERFLDEVREAAERNALQTFRFDFERELAKSKGVCPRCESELPWSETCSFCRPTSPLGATPNVAHVAGTVLTEPRHIFVVDQGGTVTKRFVEGRVEYDA